MPETNVNVIRGLYEAYARDDFEAISRALDPVIECYQSESLPWGGRYRGVEGAREFLTKVRDYLESRVVVEQWIPAGDRVATFGHSVGSVRATGQTFRIPVIHLWTLRDRKPIRFDVYLDEDQMLQALSPAVTTGKPERA